MSDDETMPKGFESPYQQFLWKELGIIREYERHGYYYLALDCAVSLVNYVSPQLRAELGENKGEEILAKVDQAVEQEGRKASSWFSSQVVRNREAKRLGRPYLRRFIRMLSDSMGGRAYMERLRRKVPEGGET